MKRLKILLIWTTSLMLLLTLLISLFPLDNYIGRTEQSLSESLGSPMHIGKMRLGILPLPHLILMNAQLGTEGEHITAASVDIRPDWLSLFQGLFVIKSIHMHEGSAHLTQIRKLVTHLSIPSTSGANNVGLQSLGFSGMQLLLPNHTLDSVDGELKFDHGRELGRAWLAIDKRKLTAVLIAQQPASFNLKLQATRWTPSFAPQLTLQKLQIDGKLLFAESTPQFSGNLNLGQLEIQKTLAGRNVLLTIANIESPVRLTPEIIQLETIKSTFSGGALSGNLQLNLPSPLLSGSLHSKNIALEPLMHTLFNQSRFSGNLDSDLNFSLPINTELPLQERLNFSARYTVSDGVLKEINLVEAAKNPGQDSNSGSTAFDSLNGLVNGDATGYYFEPIQIASGLLDARGGVTITHEMALAGWLDVDVKNTVGLVSMPMSISGTLAKPVVRPSKSALAGAAVGTAVLGPLGTALGVKIGGFINRHTNNTPKRNSAHRQIAPQ